MIILLQLYFKSLTYTLSIVLHRCVKSLTYSLFWQLPSHGETNRLPRAAGPPSGGIAVARGVSDDSQPHVETDSTVSSLLLTMKYKS
jgi:hypothetical protein